MAINWQMLGTADWNRLNSCCCPQDCDWAELEIMSRTAVVCYGGWSPFQKMHEPEDTDPEPYPDAFDPFSPVGGLIPVYRHREEGQRFQWKSKHVSRGHLYGTGNVLLQTWETDGNNDYDETVSVGSEFQQLPEHWPASNYPYDECGPMASLTLPAPPDDIAVLDGSGDPPWEGHVCKKVTWTENRPTYTVDEETLYAGAWDVMLDGSLHGTFAPEYEFWLTAGDTTCHEVRVRNTTAVGGEKNGKWSDPIVFSLNDNPCCEIEQPDCSDSTTGNQQSSVSQSVRNRLMGRLDSEYFNGSITTPYTGYHDACDGLTPPAPFAPLSWDHNTPPGGNTHSGWETRTPSTALEIDVAVEWDENTDSPNPAYRVWHIVYDQSEGLLSITNPAEDLIEHVSQISTSFTIYSDNRNAGETSAAAMFTEAVSQLSALTATWGWEEMVFAYPAGTSAPASYPVIGDQYPPLQTTVHQMRYRWFVPESHLGSTYKIRWNIARFSAQWLEWRGAYYGWALDKYAYLHKPHPGDDDYPVIGDFYDDPETPENEAHDALLAAIAAIDAIEDPGAAPDEPTAQRPFTIGDELEWEWSATQAEEAFETISECDPTYEARSILPPDEVPPLGPDPTPEQIAAHDAALEAYAEALAQYEIDLAERAARSRRQSPWQTFTPPRHCREIAKPTAPSPLPTDPDPTAAQVARHARLTAAYNTLKSIWKAARRETYQVCNVRYICSPNNPLGELPNYDPAYLTTELPPLDPAESNPERWSDYYDERGEYEPAGPSAVLEIEGVEHTGMALVGAAGRFATVSLTATVRNTGPTVLTISEINSANAYFTAPSPPAPIAAGTAADIAISFNPGTTPGVFFGNVAVAINTEIGSIEIPVAGISLEPLWHRMVNDAAGYWLEGGFRTNTLLGGSAAAGFTGPGDFFVGIERSEDLTNWALGEVVDCAETAIPNEDGTYDYWVRSTIPAWWNEIMIDLTASYDRYAKNITSITVFRSVLPLSYPYTPAQIGSGVLQADLRNPAKGNIPGATVVVTATPLTATAKHHRQAGIATLRVTMSGSSVVDVKYQGTTIALAYPFPMPSQHLALQTALTSALAAVGGANAAAVVTLHGAQIEITLPDRLTGGTVRDFSLTISPDDPYPGWDEFRLYTGIQSAAGVGGDSGNVRTPLGAPLPEAARQFLRY